MEHTVYIALGTNLGDRLANLRHARQALQPQTCILACSAVYETPPWGYLDQPKFLNQVVKTETDLEPLDLLRLLKRLEVEMGRQPSLRNGPRVIDLDLLFYDDLQLVLPELTIPHPNMAGRAFVLLPMCDLAPDLCHPQHNQTMREMLAECDLSEIQTLANGQQECNE
jgi:2-amino-4-hydroxy-6-hydroxymethyldihydropteridine diphosphokinase